MAENDNDAKNVSILLPYSTIARILLVLLIVVCTKVLAPLLMTLFLATLVAVSTAPSVSWLESRGLRRSVATSLVAILLAGSMLTIVALIVPKLFEETSNFITNLPKLKEQVLEELPPTSFLRPLAEQIISKKTTLPAVSDIAPILNAGNVALGGLTEVALIFVFSIYLIADGRRITDWITAFFNRENQAKLRQTANEISPIISSYVSGQFITSALSFFYVLIVMWALNVPSALLIATLAAVFDVLPVLGFFLAVIPALIFALSVSGSTALFVLFAYVFYHAVENYFIVPAVYGNRLRVSSFVILLALIAASLLAGIEGALACLPVVASYPIVERIWLKRIVGSSTIAEHASNAENG